MTMDYWCFHQTCHVAEKLIASFYSTKEEGEWSNPKPLEGINSDANEIFPMIEGKDLYFSSMATTQKRESLICL